ncbi:MAG: Rrf2 family transcriptional regulator [Clostridia bacterium]|nr:Rrf2 family transcriptional regulator [Clostridia bacterium]
MMISTRGRYALRVMVDLAENGGDHRLLSLREISERLGISRKYLESIMNTLVKADLVVSQPGKTGGYRLSRPPQDLTAEEILAPAEGTICPVSCVDEGCEEACPERVDCPTLPLWEGLDRTIRSYLSSVRLSDLIRP